MTERAKWGLWGGLVLVWAALIVLRAAGGQEPQRTSHSDRPGRVAESRAEAGGDLPATIRPRQSREAQGDFRTPKNIFAPLAESIARSSDVQQVGRARAAKPSSVVSRTPGLNPSPPSPEASAAERAQHQKDLSIQQARLLLGRYRFLGYLTEEGRSQAFLGKDHELYIVRVDESLDARIQVLSIEPTTVTLRDAATGLETTITLSNQGDGSHDADRSPTREHENAPSPALGG